MLPSLACTRSERGGPRFGAGAAGCEAPEEEDEGDEEAGVELAGVELAGVELAGLELAGAELCAHTPTLPASHKAKSQLRIKYFTGFR
jgi:hypothetical protein